MLRSRYVVGAAIVVFWLVMTSLLVDREVLVPRAEERASGLGEYDTWMSIYLPEDDGTEKKVGFVHSQAKSTWRDGIPGFSYSLLFKMRAQLMGEPSELRVDGSAWIPKDSGLSTFEFEVSSSDVHGMTIAGSIGEGAINLDVGTGDQSIPVELPIQDQVQLFGAMGSTTLNVPDLEVGEEVLIESFDPMSLSMGRARIECIGETDFTFDGETIPVKRLETTLSGLTSETWVTAKEEVVYVRPPSG